MVGNSALIRSDPNWHRANEFLGMMPIVVLSVILAWLAFAQKPTSREAGSGTVENVQSPGLALSVPPSVPMLIVAVGPQRAEQLRDLLKGEASLRAALGEEVRQAEVIGAADSEDAERIAEAVRTQLVFGSSHVAVVVR